MSDTNHLLWQPNDDYFRDLSLATYEVSVAPNGDRTINAHCSLNGIVGGICVVIPTGWRPATVGGSIPIYSGLIELRSLGMASDRFLQMAAQIWEVPLGNKRMAPAVAFQTIALEGNPASSELGLLKLKLFYEGSADSDYAEFYLNIDPVAGLVEIAEKDESYRGSVISALANCDPAQRVPAPQSRRPFNISSWFRRKKE